MNLHDFIFTKKNPQRYYRHIVFWAAQYLFWGFWAGSFFCSIADSLSWFTGSAFFIPEMIYTYLIVYYFFPKYILLKKYRQFFLWVAAITFISYLVYVLYHFWRGDWISGRDLQEKLLGGWYTSVNFFIKGPPIVCALFLTIKILKSFYEKMEEKHQLVNENANAELQLLKAQVHPHFLFNTLNNIYSFSLTNSVKAKKSVLRLSDTLRYMIYDCEQSLVPLSKEMKLLKDYMALEKIRYGNRLKMEIEIEGNDENKFIAPLLMVPFVENCFKHGASQMIEECWVKLRIEIDDNMLLVEISNSKLSAPAKKSCNGIGLNNVQKRLELIYPGKYHLQIVPKENSYHVYLQLELNKVENNRAILNDFSSVKSYSYA